MSKTITITVFAKRRQTADGKKLTAMVSKETYDSIVID